MSGDAIRVTTALTSLPEDTVISNRTDRAAADPRVADLVQAGEIRFAVFLPQYRKDAATGGLAGVGMGHVAIEMTRALAAQLGVAPRAVELETPLQAVGCVKNGDCDLGYLGIEPSRAAVLDFSPPIIQFDYTLLVPKDSAIENFAAADRPGVRIAVVNNHASTFALKRIVQRATIIGADLPEQTFENFRAGRADAFAAPRDHLLDFAEKLPGSRVLDDGYGVNNVGIAVAKDRPERLSFISDFVADAKSSGLIARIIEQGRLRGLRAAP